MTFFQFYISLPIWWQSFTKYLMAFYDNTQHLISKTATYVSSMSKRGKVGCFTLLWLWLSALTAMKGFVNKILSVFQVLPFICICVLSNFAVSPCRRYQGVKDNVTDWSIWRAFGKVLRNNGRKTIGRNISQHTIIMPLKMDRQASRHCIDGTDILSWIGFRF